MNRYDFGSAVKREFVPAVGQRWKCNVSDEAIAFKSQRITDGGKRSMYLQIMEADKRIGYLIVGLKGDDFLVTRRNLADQYQPHLRSRVHTLKREWLKNFEFVGFENIYGDA